MPLISMLTGVYGLGGGISYDSHPQIDFDGKLIKPFVEFYDGEQANLMEILPEQISGWEALTGLTLEPAPTSESGDAPDPVQMEQALNELGVETR